MRLVVAVLLLVGLAACKRERTFDERYAATANQIGQEAANLDEQLNRAETNEQDAEPSNGTSR